jgi:hypothetical protein
MRHQRLSIIITSCLALTIFFGCTKKLDLVPTNDILADDAYATPLGYKQALAKVYGSMALIGNAGATGGRDVPSQIISDDGNSDFLRPYWYLQCLSTDEAGWTYHGNTDPLGIHELRWSAVNQTVAGAYYRSFFIITMANDFIRQSADDKLAARGISGADADNIKKYKAEARFIRAYQYWVLMDLYGNPPFVTEVDEIGIGLPRQISRKDLFSYIESELKAIEADLVAPRANEYGRADKAAAWSLLARMYLNAEVYAGTPKYTEAITYCNKVITAGYTLHNNFKELMLADNHLNTDEFIFTINYDGLNTQNWGGTTLLIHGPAIDSKDQALVQTFKDSTGTGTGGSWGCIRITQQFVDKFDNSDIRGQFWTTGQNKTMTQLLDVPTDGYSSTKYRNKTRTGGLAPHRDPAGNWSDVDFPVFRLGEIYLTYAEAVLRGGAGGSNATALSYLDLLNRRGRPSAGSSTAQLTLPYIIDERGRELFWECIRRTDLIRFGLFTTSTYLWAWKGGVQSGSSVDSKYNLYPIPSNDLGANPNLKQNTGY